MSDPLLDTILNLSQFHREHEKFYAQEPRAQAVTLQRHARAIQALADRWSTTAPHVAGRSESLRGKRRSERPGGAAARRRALHGRRR